MMKMRMMMKSKKRSKGYEYLKEHENDGDKLHRHRPLRLQPPQHHPVCLLHFLPFHSLFFLFSLPPFSFVISITYADTLLTHCLLTATNSIYGFMF